MRYIKITAPDMFWGKDEITKDDLAEVLQGRTDAIIDIQELKRFNAKDNKWEEIPQ
jgi:hypothetical protein